MTYINLKPNRIYKNSDTNLQRYFNEFSDIHSCDCKSFSPNVDIYETDGITILELEVPGVKKEDIKISVKDNVLKIEGEKKSKRDEEQSKYFTTERIYGEFVRNLKLDKEFFQHFSGIELEGVLRRQIGPVEVMDFTLLCSFKLETIL